MSDELVQPSKTATHEETLATAVRIGPLAVQTPRGPAVFYDAPGILTSMIDRPSGKSIGLFLYDPDIGFGLVAQANADVARTWAASFLRLAAELDGGVRPS